MKLSEAINKGAETTLPIAGVYYKQQPVNKDGSMATFTCVIGAAYLGVTGKLPPSSQFARGEIMDTIRKGIDGETPYYINSIKGLPDELEYYCAREGGVTNLHDALAHLNDKCKWPRQKIADWLESIGY